MIIAAIEQHAPAPQPRRAFSFTVTQMHLPVVVFTFRRYVIRLFPDVLLVVVC